ncbi:uncharacterized protein ARMOST_12270 [Armillaria ostoyae]|uniref:Uncharacterized protein n=1 Tax=Armillaria ostoyae TaxID=47428 RepID=A0A284RJK0_ARMOS|nr:uncharacterized protein ARMOST_12270 [Armillaria ostoyae]
MAMDRYMRPPLDSEIHERDTKISQMRHRCHAGPLGMANSPSLLSTQTLHKAAQDSWVQRSTVLVACAIQYSIDRNINGTGNMPARL